MEQQLQDMIAQREERMTLSMLTGDPGLQKLINAIPVGVMLIDSNGIVQEANAVACSIGGFDRSDIVGCEYIAVWHQPVTEQRRPVPMESSVVATVLRTLQPVMGRVLGICVDDVDRWLQVSSFPLMDKQGNLDLIVHTMVDITESVNARHQNSALAALGKRVLVAPSIEHAYRDVVTTARNVFSVDYTKILMLVDRRLLVVAGDGWEEGIVGHYSIEAIGNTQAGYTLNSSYPVLVEDLPNERRFRGHPLLHDHGVRSGMTAVIGPPEHPWGVLGVHSRVARHFSPHDSYILQAMSNLLYAAIERDAAIQSIKEGERRFRALFNRSIIGIIILGTNGELLESNNHFLLQFGFTSTDQVSIDHLSPPESREQDRQAWEQVLCTGSCLPYHKFIRNREGEIVEALFAGTKLDDDRVVGFVIDLMETR